MLDTPEAGTPDTQIPEEFPTNSDRTPAELEALAAKLREHIIPSTRIDGWNAARQVRFLEAIAEGDTVTAACRYVKLSPASAYAFRRRAKGRAFDLGWKGADLLARERVAATLMLRAVEGQEVTITRPDGTEVTRHYADNRLAVQMLNRLDRYADASERTAPGHAARLVAADFDSYLDVIGQEGGPARAGLFMLAREDSEAAELEPVLALARADRIIRCGTATGDLDVADLDPARRAEWTAEQWARAEAAGVVVLAPAPKPEAAPVDTVSTCQPVSTSAPADPLDAPDSPVWFDEETGTWRTHFPPPEDFDGDEAGAWDDADYQRDLSEEERTTLNLTDPDPEDELAEAEAERDAWIAACAAFSTARAAPADDAHMPDACAADAPGKGTAEFPVAHHTDPETAASDAEHGAFPPVDRAQTLHDG